MVSRLYLFVMAFICLLTTISAVSAQDAPSTPNSTTGSLTLKDHTLSLSDAVAYETKRNGERYTAILASNRKIPWDKIEAALKEKSGGDEQLVLDQPYLIVLFTKSGKVDSFSASDGKMSVSRFGRAVSGKLENENGRTRGEAHLKMDPSAMGKVEFDLQWELPFGGPVASVSPMVSAGPVKPSVSGEFHGNGKEAKLAYVSAYPGEPFDGKPVIVVVLSEKDHSRDSKAFIRAGFGDYGSALIVSLLPDGKVIGCEVAHAAHAKKPFSSPTSLHAGQFELGNGRVAGELTTDGEQTAFDQKWDAKLKFVAPYAPPKAETPTIGSVAAETKKQIDSKAGIGSKSSSKDEQRPDESSKTPSGDQLKVKELAMPADASDIVYKKLVQQMTFQSGTAIQPLTEEFSKKLAAQGWKPAGGADLVTAKSAILRRSRGAAKLTIIVKPADQGCKVTIMSEGLDWSGQD